MTRWTDLEPHDSHRKWNDWQIKDEKSLPAVKYAAAMCFALAAIAHSVMPIV